MKRSTVLFALGCLTTMCAVAGGVALGYLVFGAIVFPAIGLALLVGVATAAFLLETEA